MTQPIPMVEIWRGDLLESQHMGHAVVCDADGQVVESWGDDEKVIYPRSSCKMLQALPLIESGAADAFGFGDRELSLACASHSGEAGHIALARDMLSRAGLDETCLECGGHWSSQGWVMRHQTTLYSDTPPAICNNCSGKHSGFVCTAAHRGIDPAGYIKRDHRIQQAVNEALQDVTGAQHDEDICGTDGCSIPTYAIPLSAMARGFARMATGQGIGDERSKAAKRLLNNSKV